MYHYLHTLQIAMFLLCMKNFIKQFLSSVGCIFNGMIVACNLVHSIGMQLYSVTSGRSDQCSTHPEKIRREFVQLTMIMMVFGGVWQLATYVKSRLSGQKVTQGEINVMVIM